MKVALLVDLPKIGKAGDIKEVTDGYAKNFLIPSMKAVPASKGVMSNIKTSKYSRFQKRTRHETEVKDIAALIKD